jgi:hypothetical protein
MFAVLFKNLQAACLLQAKQCMSQPTQQTMLHLNSTPGEVHQFGQSLSVMHPLQTFDMYRWFIKPEKEVHGVSSQCLHSEVVLQRQLLPAA